jgi:hypothetical protein
MTIYYSEKGLQHLYFYGLGVIRAKIGPTSDVVKISPKCIHNMCISEINTVS